MSPTVPARGRIWRRWRQPGHVAPQALAFHGMPTLLVFGMMAVGSFSSGELLANYGWSAVNLVVYPPVLLGLTVLMLVSFARRRAKLQTLSEFPDPGM